MAYIYVNTGVCNFDNFDSSGNCTPGNSLFCYIMLNYFLNNDACFSENNFQNK